MYNLILRLKLLLVWLSCRHSYSHMKVSSSMVQSLHAIRGDFNSALLTASVNMALVLVKIRPIVLFALRSAKHGAIGGDSIILKFPN